MEMTSYQPGVPSWVDLGVPDPDAAAAFYSGLFGWVIDEGPPEAGGYRMCMLRGHAVAGLGPQMNPAAPPNWQTYVTVADAAATAARVTELGGQVFMPPMQVMTAGTMAIFADPSGAVFSVWQPDEHIGAGLVNEPGTLSWNELITTDVEGSIAFYEALFGWGHETADPDGPMPYTEWKLDGRSIGGMMAKNEMMPAEMPSVWSPYFAVLDCDAAVAKVTELGGAVIVPPTDIEPGRFAVVADPAGAVFNVMAFKEGLGG